MVIVIKKKQVQLIAPVEKPEPLPKQERQKHFVNGPLLDSECLWVMGQNPNAAIPWWMMASYLYYQEDLSILSDGLYDEMAKAMLEAWHVLDHMHKHLITKDDLRAGSLYRLRRDEYPGMCIGGATHLIYVNWKYSINRREHLK